MAIEYIGPTGPIFDTAKVARQIDSALRELAGEAQSDFADTVRTWETSVSFVTAQQSREEYSVGTDNEIYGYVNAGTRPHTIKARDGGQLAFQTGYNAKTTPRQIGSSSGGAFGPFAYAKEVRHPGTDAREFDQAIAEKLQPQATRTLQRAATP